ncbi:hypothetical protein FYJ86_01465 [Corynebacterium urealyticum]|uniref:class I SAM-dependent methyltransferase n=1 Tax=Corynebacterium urealyticum TaxID=43771 RepID=UPI0011E782AE|nr:hypothetical protein [Corynebacterium urealyticum]TYR18198.1 hypothetical protein FYJ88_05125 [Corynebacterium urealyticum]TYT21475.1 hypothetical protein FYJ86_01465 [Corynebacterium urealyticum]
MSFSLEELQWLQSSPDAGTAIAQAGELELSQRSVVSDTAALRKAWGDNARAVAELVEARRIAAAKLSAELAAGWWTDKDAAQQSTPLAVARFRARHLAALGVAVARDVTCSVGTELVALKEAGLTCSGSDIDPVRVAMARTNCPGVEVRVADALEPWEGTPGEKPVILADPARRNSSGRIHRLEDMQPPVSDLVGAYPGHELMVKLAPGVDFAELEDWAGQVDVISVDGQAKEACALTSGLVSPEARDGEGLARRAVVISTSDQGEGVDILASWEPELSDDDVAARAGQPGRYIMEPDAAIIRAGLVRHFAARERLWLVDPNLAYVTGEHVPAGMRAFEVLDTVPVKQLRKALQQRGVGKLEILVRGADINPDQLRAKLKLKGKGKATVVIARLGERNTKQRGGGLSSGVVAYICRAVAPEKH